MKTIKDLEHLQNGKDGRIFVEYYGDVAILMMDKGENRMNDLFIDGINKALDEIEGKGNIKAVITTGVGKFYSNGLDLNWLMEVRANVPDYARVFSERWQRMQSRMLTFPILTIAALNGHTFAGGAVFSMMHDYRVMSTERGWWCLNEVKINLRFSPWMINVIKLRLTSPRALTDAVVLGKRCTAKDSLDLGIVHLTSSMNDLLKTAQSLAQQVLPPNEIIDRGSLANMKQDLYRDILNQLAENDFDINKNQAML
jgi:enoyl-CoA hydratase/carnithine racemase